MTNKKINNSSEDLLNIYDNTTDNNLLDVESIDNNESLIEIKDDLNEIEGDNSSKDESSIEIKDDLNEIEGDNSSKDESLIEIKDNLNEIEGDNSSINGEELEEFNMEENIEEDNGEKKSFFGNLFKKKTKIQSEAVDELSPENGEELEEFNMEENIEEDNGEKKSFFGNLFKKKTKIQSEVVDESSPENGEDNNDSVNIFDDFNQDDSLIDEIDKIKKDSDRDLLYYIDKAGNIMQVIFMVSLLFIILIYSYIIIQNKVFVDNKDNQMLDPFCTILLGSINYEGTFCTSVSTLKNDYEKKLKDTKDNQISDILNILQSLYKIENFTKTKDVVFLKDKTTNKLKVLEVLEEFDNLKSEFDTVDKDKIQCYSLIIDEKTETLSMNCIAYSAGFESGIRGFNGKNDSDSLVKGTSISIANSFLNYIGLESKVFTIVNRQKVFKSESIVGDKTGFTNKTVFNLKLKYNIK